MNVDDEDDNLSVSSEFLRESTAKNSQTAANSDENGMSDTNNANGDTTDDQTPIAKTLEDDDFIKVFKPTKFIGTIRMEDLKGNLPSEKLQIIQRRMITHAGFISAKINRKNQSIDVHFGNEYDLSKMIDFYRPALQDKNFRMVNSRQAREAEKGRTIRVTDIPLNITSSDIKSFFDKEGEVTRFSMVISDAWQHAYVVYTDPRSIATFYDHVWSI